MSKVPSPPNGDFVCLQAEFLSILPDIERWAHFTHRHLDNFHDREDAVADAIADAWALFLHLAEQDDGPTPFRRAANGSTDPTKTGNARRSNQTVLRNHQPQSREVKS